MPIRIKTHVAHPDPVTGLSRVTTEDGLHLGFVQRVLKPMHRHRWVGNQQVEKVQMVTGWLPYEPDGSPSAPGFAPNGFDTRAAAIGYLLRVSHAHVLRDA